MKQRTTARRHSEVKVWIVAPFPPPYGGMSLQAEMLAERLAGEGLSVERLATNPRPARLLRSVERIPGVRTVVREIQYLLSLRSILHGRGAIHHFSASYLFFFLHSAPLLLLAKLSKSNLVLNYRGGKAANFFKWWSWVVVPLLRAADQVAVPSEYLQRVFQHYGVSSTVLPNIADIELFPFVERVQFSPRLFVSRHLEPMYDVECVLRAFRRIQQSVPHATLGIAGDGTQTKRLERLVDDWCLRGVTFYGAVPHVELPALYSQHDIYVNGSRVDNFPGALVEAACSGLPIVTTRAGGIGEMIQHGKNGLLVDVGDDSALAGGVLDLLHRQGFAQDLTRNARCWAEQFSWRRVFRQLLGVYGITGEEKKSEVQPDRILVP